MSRISFFVLVYFLNIGWSFLQWLQIYRLNGHSCSGYNWKYPDFANCQEFFVLQIKWRWKTLFFAVIFNVFLKLRFINIMLSKLTQSAKQEIFLPLMIKIKEKILFATLTESYSGRDRNWSWTMSLWFSFVTLYLR